jgi:DNA-binding HxlR family transcriptional regulator
MSQRDRLGDATLDLLIDECTLIVLRQLSEGPTRARDIEARSPGIAGWTARRRLRTLTSDRFVTAEGSPASSTGGAGALHSLTELGHACLLGVLSSAAYCERTWCIPAESPIEPGLWAIKLVSDRRTRAIVRALADGPQRFSDLQVRVSGLTRSAFLRRLKVLPGYGVLVREGAEGDVRYALSDNARHLTVIALRAAHCELQRGDPEALPSDLLGRMHLLAPLARIPRSVTGTCRWRLDSQIDEPDLDIVAAAGRIAAVTTPPLRPPQACCHATPERWCEALLHCDATKLHTTGDAALVEAVLTGLSSALLA